MPPTVRAALQKTGSSESTVVVVIALSVGTDAEVGAAEEPSGYSK
jgi:hypothetical protein